MKMIALTTSVLSLCAAVATAEERVEINTIYPLNQTYYQLADSVYYTQDNKGSFEVIEGPFESGPARCIGAGFGYRDGTSTINGICIFGEGEDTFIMRWDAGQQGDANTWQIVNGSGRYEGMTGEGIATSGMEVVFKAMPLRQTHIIGTVTLKDR